MELDESDPKVKKKKKKKKYFKTSEKKNLQKKIIYINFSLKIYFVEI
jgi:hypothetical protein